VYKLDSFVGFIGDEQVQSQECYEQLAGGKHMENNCFPRTLKFEMEATASSDICGRFCSILSIISKAPIPISKHVVRQLITVL
jgi:hypothetical protein